MLFRSGIAIGYSKDTRTTTGMSMKLGKPTNTFTNLMEAYLKAYEKSTDKEHPVRRVSLWAGGLTKEGAEQLELFTEMETNESERELERTMNNLKKKFGKSAVLRGINLSEEGTTRERNKLIGGHNAN